MNNLIFLVMIAVLVSVTVGNAMALILLDDTVKVTGEMVVQRDTGPSAITVQNNQGFSNAIKFWDVDDSQVFQFRLIGTGDRLDILDVTNNRIGVSMLSSNGNVGINNVNPTEQLDVTGNIKLSGNIVSNGDICIGTCN